MQLAKTPKTQLNSESENWNRKKKNRKTALQFGNNTRYSISYEINRVFSAGDTTDGQMRWFIMNIIIIIIIIVIMIIIMIACLPAWSRWKIL